MFKQVREGKAFPVTNPPSVASYQKTLESLLQKHSHVFAIHPSHFVSSTLEVACEAAQAFAGRVTIHNSQAITGAMALQAERAARLLRSGVEPEQVNVLLQALQSQTHSRLCLNTTEFFRRSGRVADPLSLLGGMLNVKPILSIKNGELTASGTALTQRGSLNMMREQLRRAAQQISQPRIVFFHNEAQESIQELRQLVQELGILEVMTLELGVVLSAHAGPQAYGFSIEPTQVWHNFRQFE